MLFELIDSVYFTYACCASAGVGLLTVLFWKCFWSKLESLASRVMSKFSREVKTSVHSGLVQAVGTCGKKIARCVVPHSDATQNETWISRAVLGVSLIPLGYLIYKKLRGSNEIKEAAKRPWPVFVSYFTAMIIPTLLMIGANFSEICSALTTVKWYVSSILQIDRDEAESDDEADEEIEVGSMADQMAQSAHMRYKTINEVVDAKLHELRNGWHAEGKTTEEIEQLSISTRRELLIDEEKIRRDAAEIDSVRVARERDVLAARGDAKVADPQAGKPLSEFFSKVMENKPKLVCVAIVALSLAVVSVVYYRYNHRKVDPAVAAAARDIIVSADALPTKKLIAEVVRDLEAGKHKNRKKMRGRWYGGKDFNPAFGDRIVFRFDDGTSADMNYDDRFKAKLKVWVMQHGDADYLYKTNDEPKTGRIVWVEDPEPVYHGRNEEPDEAPVMAPGKHWVDRRGTNKLVSGGWERNIYDEFLEGKSAVKKMIATGSGLVAPTVPAGVCGVCRKYPCECKDIEIAVGTPTVSIPIVMTAEYHGKKCFGLVAGGNVLTPSHLFTKDESKEGIDLQALILKRNGVVFRPTAVNLAKEVGSEADLAVISVTGCPKSVLGFAPEPIKGDTVWMHQYKWEDERVEPTSVQSCALLDVTSMVVKYKIDTKDGDCGLPIMGSRGIVAMHTWGLPNQQANAGVSGTECKRVIELVRAGQFKKNVPLA
jgi:hypothetical protein